MENPLNYIKFHIFKSCKKINPIKNQPVFPCKKGIFEKNAKGGGLEMCFIIQ